MLKLWWVFACDKKKDENRHAMDSEDTAYSSGAWREHCSGNCLIIMMIMWIQAH